MNPITFARQLIAEYLTDPNVVILDRALAAIESSTPAPLTKEPPMATKKYIALLTLGAILEANEQGLKIEFKTRNGSWSDITGNSALDKSSEITRLMDEGGQFRTPKILTYTELSTIDECMVMQGLEREIHFNAGAPSSKTAEDARKDCVAVQGLKHGWVEVSDETRKPDYFEKLLSSDTYCIRVEDL